jgi:hypothetical protein
MPEAPEWLARPFTEADTDGLLFLLGAAYCWSRAGVRAGAARELRGDGRTSTPASKRAFEDARDAFMNVHRPVWTWLLEHAETELLVDPEVPDIIWGWLVTSGDRVVHALGCKRSFTERKPGVPPPSVEIVMQLAGERLRTHQVCTLELPQMRSAGSGAIGLDRPREWSLDPTWLVTHMRGSP